jgi:6-phosphogluconate dehydrogenase (decarboxylating)
MPPPAPFAIIGLGKMGGNLARQALSKGFHVAGYTKGAAAADLVEAGLIAGGGLNDLPPSVEDTGEVNWLVDDALHMETPLPVITQSVIQLLASRDERKNWGRAIAMMRHGFDGHPFGRDEGIARERKRGRVGGFPDDDKP